MTQIITVPGPPVPKARPRVTRYGTYTPKSTKEYEGRIVAAWEAAGAERFPAATPLAIAVLARFPIPRSASKRKRQSMEGTWHTGHRADLDNVVKAVQDALNGHAYPDDCTICLVRAQKSWAAEASTTIIIHTIKEEDHVPEEV